MLKLRTVWLLRNLSLDSKLRLRDDRNATFSCRCQRAWAMFDTLKLVCIAGYCLNVSFNLGTGLVQDVYLLVEVVG